MAKLYWRVKIDGKWTWRPAICGYCKVHDEKYVCDDCCYINTPEGLKWRHGGSAIHVKRTILRTVPVGLVDQQLMLSVRTECNITLKTGRLNCGAQVYLGIPLGGNEVSRYRCWKVYTCRRCLNVRIAFSKRVRCDLCTSVDRQGDHMHVTGWLV
jgi:hypothetical protein